jgi:hypothetical protein
VTVLEGMSPSMWAALAAMPVVLDRTSRGYCKPVGAPCSASLEALQARGFVECHRDEVPPRWARTPLGEEVWAHR